MEKVFYSQLLLLSVLNLLQIGKTFYELSNIKSCRIFFKTNRGNNIVDLKADYIG